MLTHLSLFFLFARAGEMKERKYLKKSENFVREFINSCDNPLDIACTLIEALEYKSIIGRLNYIFRHYPELRHLSGTKLSKLVGFDRTGISRAWKNLNWFMEARE